MDFITDLPPVTSSAGTVNALLVMIDKFTKYTRLAPVFMGGGGLTAQQTARVFFEHVVRFFGVPDSILSDRDPRFTAEFWKAMWGILGTRVVLSSAYHPQTDGQTERQNRTVE